MCIVGPHCETFVDLGPGGQPSAVQMQLPLRVRRPDH